MCYRRGGAPLIDPHGPIVPRRRGGEKSREHERRLDGEIIVTKADEDAIREIELRFNRAWGRHDADTMVESLVDVAQFITVNGAWTTTHEGFRDLMRRLHAATGASRSTTRETPWLHVRALH